MKKGVKKSSKRTFSVIPSPESYKRKVAKLKEIENREEKEKEEEIKRLRKRVVRSKINELTVKLVEQLNVGVNCPKVTLPFEGLPDIVLIAKGLQRRFKRRGYHSCYTTYSQGPDFYLSRQQEPAFWIK